MRSFGRRSSSSACCPALRRRPRLRRIRHAWRSALLPPAPQLAGGQLGARLGGGPRGAVLRLLFERSFERADFGQPRLAAGQVGRQLVTAPAWTKLRILGRIHALGFVEPSVSSV